MHNLAVQIVRFVDSDAPGWVECELLHVRVTRDTGWYTTADTRFPRRVRYERVRSRNKLWSSCCTP
jgi:hypothetical protein